MSSSVQHWPLWAQTILGVLVLLAAVSGFVQGYYDAKAIDEFHRER